MTVRELRELLAEMPQDLPVAYHLHSEFKLMEPDDIAVRSLQKARPDGWVARNWRTRPEDPAIPLVPYVVFPGN